jgi:hypothetical protein
MDVQSNIIKWLLEDENPSVKFRTLKEVLDYGDDKPEIRRAKSAILQSSPVQISLEEMHPAGY